MIAPPDPAATAPTAAASCGLRIEKLKMSPAEISVRPAATGMSLKSTWESPSHSGVARVNDQAKAAASHDRSASARASAKAVTETIARIRLAIPW